MNTPAEETIAGANHKALRSRVPDAGSKLRFRLSREATAPYIAETVTTPEREAAAVGDFKDVAVSI